MKHQQHQQEKEEEEKQKKTKNSPQHLKNKLVINPLSNSIPNKHAKRQINIFSVYQQILLFSSAYIYPANTYI